MRLILWAIGCLFAAIAAVQLIIEGMLAAFGGSWTRLLSVGDVFEQIGGPGTGAWLPSLVTDAPPWIPAIVVGAAFLYWGRFKRQSARPYERASRRAG